ncbi:MAG: short-chain fatty acid transporter [Deltaproteobacteria bacterium]|nr:short-chain fatty acid transporter [Deltaproteobacteria bacterium]
MNSQVAFFVPHSFLFVILLTFAAYMLGILKAYQGPFDMIKFWVNGFWNLLSFSMQMVIMVAAAFSVASVPIGQKVLRALAVIPKTPRGGMMFLTATIALLSWLHWGIGIVAGAFLAREMGRRIQQIDYPMLVACAYVGLCAGTFGLFAHEPLAVSKAGHFLEKAIGTIPLSQTSFSTMALVGFCLGTVAVTALMGIICPEGKEATPPNLEILRGFEEEERAEEASLVAEREMRQKGGMSFSVWLEHSRWPVWLISIMGFSYILYWFYGRGFDLNLNILNFVLLLLAFSLHDTPRRFLQSMERSARAVYGIIVQFPFYAGIQGMLASSGLAAIFFKWITSASTEAAYPLWVFIDAAFVNLFVPTSGGIWEIQGSLVVKAAQELNASIPRAINGFTAGEVIGNIIQPFWAIPLLGITGLSLRDIMGYCFVAFFVLSLIWILCVTFLPI